MAHQQEDEPRPPASPDSEKLPTTIASGDDRSNCVMDGGWTSALTSSTFQWNIRAKRRAAESSLRPRVYAKRTFVRNKLNLCALSLWCYLLFKLAPMHISPVQHRNTSRTLMAGTHRSSLNKHEFQKSTIMFTCINHSSSLYVLEHNTFRQKFNI